MSKDSWRRMWPSKHMEPRPSIGSGAQLCSAIFRRQAVVDFTLDWMPHPAAHSTNARTIFTNTKKNLGLQVKKQDRPMPILVVDHLDRAPTRELAAKRRQNLGRPVSKQPVVTP